MKLQGKKSLTLKNLSKSNIWDIQENDVFRLLENGEKDADMKDNLNHYADIIRSAFTIEVLDSDVPNVKKKYDQLGYKVGSIKLEENTKLFGEDIGGRPLLLVGVMLVLMGVQLIAAGLIGELLTRIYHEAGGVPQFHAEEYVPGDEPNGGPARADTAPAATSSIA